MGTAVVLFVITAFLSIVKISSSTLHDQVENCKGLAQGSLDWSHEDIATVAGSYIPGDLYWSRPQYSLAPCFSLERIPQLNQGCPARIQMKLDKQCASDLYRKTSPFPNQYKIQADLEPLFYVRLVGPAIIIGDVERVSLHQFTISFTPTKPGLYMLDVVVEFSSIVNNNSLAFYKQESTYEGRPIPGSPFAVTVAPNSQHELPQRPCTGAEIGTAPGTWVLADDPSPHTGPVDFVSANFFWFPDTCTLPDLKCIVAASTKGTGKCLSPGQTAMIYAIGDSVTRVQAQSLGDLLGEKIVGEGESYTQETHRTVFDIHFQATNDGMIPRMVFIKQSIDRLIECQRSGTCTPVIHFNSGLHDLDKYCGNLEHQIGFRQGSGLAETFDCMNSYVTRLEEVVDYVTNSGLQGVKIFRTTTAAWLKFGNYQVNWFEPDKRDEQVFISNWLSVVKFNELAVPVFQRAGWHIIDGFQSSIGRPDHTERTPGGALVHFDDEVPETHNHQLLSIILEELCPKVLKSCSNSHLSRDVQSSQPVVGVSRSRNRRGASGTSLKH